MKLHLGSGSRYLEGYLHVDIADYEHIDIKSSVDKLNTIDNDTVDEIYASHVLEYFDRNEVRSALCSNGFRNHGLTTTRTTPQKNTSGRSLTVLSVDFWIPQRSDWFLFFKQTN